MWHAACHSPPPSLYLSSPFHFHCSMLSACLWSPKSHVVAALHNLLEANFKSLFALSSFALSSIPCLPTFHYFLLTSFFFYFSLLSLLLLLLFFCCLPHVPASVCRRQAQYALSLRALHTLSVDIINGTHSYKYTHTY